MLKCVKLCTLSILLIMMTSPVLSAHFWDSHHSYRGKEKQVSPNGEILIHRFGLIHRLYTVHSRIAESFYSYYDGEKWSSPVWAGGEYPSMAIGKEGVFIASSFNHHLCIKYRIGGEWHTQFINTTWTTVTAVYAGDGVEVAWRGNHSIWVAHFDGTKFGAVEKVADEEYPVRKIEISKPSVIKTSQEGLLKWVNITYHRENRWKEVERKITMKNGISAEFPKLNVKYSGKGTALWTYMVYMDEDNSLNGYGYNGDLQEMIAGYNASAEGKVRIVVLDDGRNNGDTKLYYVDDSGAHDISSGAPWLKSEMNMGDPTTLIDFVTWTEENYPAKYYFLDMWDHGMDYDGAMWDDTSVDHLSLQELKYAADEILSRTGRAIDIWGYDACLMNAGADNYQIKQAAKIIVASEHTEGDDGWDYTALISNLTSNPEQSPEQYAYSHVVHVDDEHSRTSIRTMTAINTTAWDESLMVAYNQLAQAIRAKAGTNNSEIRDAFNSTAPSDSRYWPSGIDVGDFARELNIYVKDPLINYWANRLLENISRSVINSYDTDTAGRKTLMGETKSYDYTSSQFYIFRDTEWDEMLRQVFTLKEDDTNMAPQCNITSPASESFANDEFLNISGNAHDPDGVVQYVQVKIDRGEWVKVNGTDIWNYTLDLKNISIGTHVIMARAYDGDLYSIPDKMKIEVSLGPDLQIKSITVNNTHPSAGESIEIGVDILNSGAANASPVEVSLYHDSMLADNLIGKGDIGEIPANSSVEWFFQWNTSHMGGWRTLIAHVDPDNSIPELNESNNIAEKNIYISGNVPDAPGNVSATADDGVVHLKWTEPYEGDAPLMEYIIYRGEKSGEEMYLNAVLSNVTEYDDHNVINGVRYYYYITAVNNVGESNRSVEVSAEPIGPPAPPRNLQIKRGDGYAALMWYSPSTCGGTDVQEYRIYRNGMYLSSVPSTTYVFVDKNLNIRENYSYYVTAVNSVGESRESNVVSVSWDKPGAPSNVNLTRGDGFAILHWDKPGYDGGTHITGYVIIRNGREIARVDSLTDMYNDSNLSVAHTYAYCIQAVNGVGAGNISKRVTVSWNAPSSPRNLTLLRGDGYVNLKWSAPLNDGGTHIVSYIIYRNGVAIGSVNGSNTGYNDTTVDMRGNWTYSVIAVNGAGTSLPAISSSVQWSTPTIDASIHAEGSILKIRILVKNDGGSAIREYRVLINSGSGWILIRESNSSRIDVDISKFIGSSIIPENRDIAVRVVAVNGVGPGNFVEDEVQVPIPIAWEVYGIIALIIAVPAVIFALRRKNP